MFYHSVKLCLNFAIKNSSKSLVFEISIQSWIINLAIIVLCVKSAIYSWRYGWREKQEYKKHRERMKMPGDEMRTEKFNSFSLEKQHITPPPPSHSFPFFLWGGGGWRCWKVFVWNVKRVSWDFSLFRMIWSPPLPFQKKKRI